MSPQRSEHATDEQIEREVVEYLRENADFLVRHPELVGTLLVPHTCGEAVSLLEYQSRRLRDENRELHERLETLVRNARDNEELGQRVHRLTLGIMECSAADELFSCLYQGLRDHFDAEFTSLRVFAAPASSWDSGLAEFVGGAASERELFDALLASDRPVCGAPGGDQAAYLFAEQGGEVKSSALVPLGGSSNVGVLGIGSRSPARYSSGMGTVFLRRIGALVTQALEPHLAR